MARTRSLKPTFFTNEDLGECSPLARLFFAGLWCWADREGYVEDRPRRLRAQILPYDQADGELLVQELVDRGLVQRLTVNGEAVLWLPTFLKHQDPHPRETPSRFAQGSPKADLGTAEDTPRSPSPTSPSCPSSPSSPSSLPAPQAPRGQGTSLAEVPDWLAGIQNDLGEMLQSTLAVGKDPEAVVEVFARRRAYHQANGIVDPDHELVCECLTIADEAKANKIGSLAFFVKWLERYTPPKARSHA